MNPERFSSHDQEKKIKAERDTADKETKVICDLPLNRLCHHDTKDEKGMCRYIFPS